MGLVCSPFPFLVLMLSVLILESSNKSLNLHSKTSLLFFSSLKYFRIWPHTPWDLSSFASLLWGLTLSLFPLSPFCSVTTASLHSPMNWILWSLFPESVVLLRGDHWAFQWVALVMWVSSNQVRYRSQFLPLVACIVLVIPHIFLPSGFCTQMHIY